MTTLHTKERVGWLLFASGLTIMLVEYLLHVWGHFHSAEYRIGLAPMGVGAVFTFIGWFWLFRQDALDGGGFVVNAFTSVIGVIRNGRRATDAAVVVAPPPATPPAPAPMPVPAPAPPGTDPDGGRS